jgi:hypothetical protein
MKNRLQNKYFLIIFHDFYWDWSIYKPEHTNWNRLVINTPFFDFIINGWLFFGKKPG